MSIKLKNIPLYIQSRSQSLRYPCLAVGKRELWKQPFWNNGILPIRFHCAVCIYGRLLHKLLGNFLATFGLSSNFWATFVLEHFFGNFFQSEKIYPFLVTKISFLCISSLTKRINIHVNSIVRLYWLQVTSDYCHQWVCVVLVWSTELWVTCGCVFPARYMVSGLKSEHVFKMAALVSSTSSERNI